MENKKKWHPGIMIGLVILAILLLVGFVIGPLNIKYESRKNQAISLIVMSFVSTIMWIIHLTGLHN